MADSGKNQGASAANGGTKMGLMQLMILTAVNMMGSGIIMLPTKLAEVGTISVLSWIVTALGSVCLAYAFAKCGMYSKRLGMGGYAEYAFGKAGNFISNYTYALSLLFANVAIAISCVGYGTTLFGVNLNPVQVCIATIAVLWFTTIPNFFGASFTGKISSVVVWAIVVPVLLLSVIGWFWFSPTMYIEAWNPHHQPFFTALSSSISLTLWAFLGLESACANSDAVENPEKNVPIAVLGATIGVAIIYIVSTNIMAGIVPNAELAKSDAPFGLVFSVMFNESIGNIVMALMVIACVGSLLGWQFTIAKVFQQSADMGFFPRWFKKMNRWGAPVLGMIILGIAQTGFSLMTISPELYEQFNALVDLAVVTNLVPYILSMGALSVILKVAKIPAEKAKVYTFIAFLGALYSFYALSSCGLKEMFYGSLVTFFGWTLWSFIDTKFLKPNATEVY